MDTSQTTVHFEELENFPKNQLSLLVPSRNTGFYMKTLKFPLFIIFTYI